MTETDPNGKNPHEPGAKLDQGKLLPDLVLGDFSNALEEVTRIGTFGAKKYTDHGWLSVPNGKKRYSEAMMRHWLKMKKGETHCSDSGEMHLSHFAWNVLAVLELTVREAEEWRRKTYDVPTESEESVVKGGPI